MIYLDNASTSYPKAPGVGAAMSRYVEEIGVNVARGGYEAALEAGNVVITLRERLCAAFGSDFVEGCILTPGATYGLNMVLKGYLRPGDHVLISAMEHNAVMRPLRQLEKLGVQVEKMPHRADGPLDPAQVHKRARPNTRLVCVTHASNVCGLVLPVKEIGAACSQLGIPLLVDASQTVGHRPIHRNEIGADALIFSAHKGLLGPQGIGAALLSRKFAQALQPYVTGGTGSRSDLEEQPLLLPDKLEAGTPNLPGIYGFLAALDFWEPRAQELAAHTQALLERFLERLSGVAGVRVMGGDTSATGRVPVVSLDFIGLDNAQIAFELERSFGILTRCGLHCAPSAHRALGSFPRGTVRFSFGWANTEAEVDAAVNAVKTLAQ